MSKDTVYLADATRLPVVARTVGDTRYFVEGCFRQGARETAVEKMRRLILNDTDNTGLPGGNAPSGGSPRPKEG